MYWEAVVAALVGLAAVVLVLEPMLRANRPGAEPLDLDDEEETPASLAVGALKEIEFDRATGKLSDADYQFLHDKYTTLALAALRTAPDASQPAMDPIEAMVAARVSSLRAIGREVAGAVVCRSCGPRLEPDALFCSNCGVTLSNGGACAKCGSPLRPDGSYCEGCGTRVAA